MSILSEMDNKQRQPKEPPVSDGNPQELWQTLQHLKAQYTERLNDVKRTTISELAKLSNQGRPQLQAELKKWKGFAEEALTILQAPDPKTAALLRQSRFPKGSAYLEKQLEKPLTTWENRKRTWASWQQAGRQGTTPSQTQTPSDGQAVATNGLPRQQPEQHTQRRPQQGGSGERPPNVLSARPVPQPQAVPPQAQKAASKDHLLLSEQRRLHLQALNKQAPVTAQPAPPKQAQQTALQQRQPLQGPAVGAKGPQQSTLDRVMHAFAVRASLSVAEFTERVRSNPALKERVKLEVKKLQQRIAQGASAQGTAAATAPNSKAPPNIPSLPNVIPPATSPATQAPPATSPRSALPVPPPSQIQPLPPLPPQVVKHLQGLSLEQLQTCMARLRERLADEEELQEGAPIASILGRLSRIRLLRQQIAFCQQRAEKLAGRDAAVPTPGAKGAGVSPSNVNAATRGVNGVGRGVNGSVRGLNGSGTGAPTAGQGANGTGRGVTGAGRAVHGVGRAVNAAGRGANEGGSGVREASAPLPGVSADGVGVNRATGGGFADGDGVRWGSVNGQGGEKTLAMRMSEIGRGVNGDKAPDAGARESGAGRGNVNWSRVNGANVNRGGVNGASGAKPANLGANGASPEGATAHGVNGTSQGPAAMKTGVDTGRAVIPSANGGIANGATATGSGVNREGGVRAVTPGSVNRPCQGASTPGPIQIMPPILPNSGSRRAPTKAGGPAGTPNVTPTNAAAQASAQPCARTLPKSVKVFRTVTINGEEKRVETDPQQIALLYRRLAERRAAGGAQRLARDRAPGTGQQVDGAEGSPREGEPGPAQRVGGDGEAPVERNNKRKLSRTEMEVRAPEGRGGERSGQPGQRGGASGLPLLPRLDEGGPPEKKLKAQIEELSARLGDADAYADGPPKMGETQKAVPESASAAGVGPEEGTSQRKQDWPPKADADLNVCAICEEEWDNERRRTVIIPGLNYKCGHALYCNKCLEDFFERMSEKAKTGAFHYECPSKCNLGPDMPRLMPVFIGC
ncbi:hypothetical protein KFL_003570010 [Klebsormidium nitens]|uniref:RING-type domain-containing protein n=1 Tax=Klebsormidium nitens TaxID=105231 RepID=A0A1Y1IBZ8_KLENI|nr:hypothetical protein KFL_003570010 [Klebsormidium nitens]|eukprot:GAQ87492.1 hypothetical protein KFL_003570010 [Klebsormidium nitens]